MSQSITYGTYLAVDELLSLQRPRSDGPEHDELLFIVIHQVYELWFKQILHEIDHVMALLEAREPHRAQHSLKRVLTILKVLVAQLDILETMTPLAFQSFRARLEAASGFQSDQFRQLEFVLGQKSATAIERFAEGSRARKALEARFAQPTLWDAFHDYLVREGYELANIQDTLIKIYRTDPKNAEICERLVDLDEGIQEWRYRHVKMVERTIGAKPGTGGSAGAEYLRTTLMKPLFPDLWEIRSRL
jgi:tryptophan 2,3-dioxygenase